MTYDVILTYKAEQDVGEVVRWFNERSAEGAGRRWLVQFVARITTLRESPERCPLAAEAPQIGLEIRELLLGRRRGKYRVLFQIDGNSVLILRVRHAARDVLRPEDF